MSIYVIQSKKNGKRYGVRFRITENGETVHKNLSSFRTQAEAKRAQIEYIQKVEKENSLKTPEVIQKLSFKELVEKYKSYIADNLAPSSVYDYYNVIDTRLMPYLGEMMVCDITKRLVTEFQDNIPSEFSFKYKNKIRTVLSAIFTFAINRDYVDFNPVSKVERIRNNRPAFKMQFWTKDEFDKFIDVVDDTKYKALFTFLYLSGCRKGEAFALEKTKINFDTNMVLIDNSITKKGLLMHEKLGKKKISKTKNSKIAEIYMPRFSLELIKNQYEEGIYAFGGDKPLTETTVTRYFNKYILIAKVKKIRMHDLRHSCAALFISMSNSELNVLYAIAERLRDSVEQILKTYGHLFPSKQAEIIRTLDSLYKA